MLSVDALGQSEDHLLLAGFADDGAPLSDETTSRLMTIAGTTGGQLSLPTEFAPLLAQSLSAQQARIRDTISERNASFFEQEADKLVGWADDLKVGLEREIEEIDRQIKEARRAATVAQTLEAKLAGQKAVKALETERNTKRRSLFDAQDRIDESRSELIAMIERKLEQNITELPLFTLRWSVA